MIPKFMNLSSMKSKFAISSMYIRNINFTPNRFPSIWSLCQTI